MFLHETVELPYGDLECHTGPNGRVYVTPEGNEYPSITTVLSILSENDIREWRQRVGEKEATRIGTIAAGRGTLVHNGVDDFISNKPVKPMMPHVSASFNQIKSILVERLGVIYMKEKPLYSDFLGVAGRTDIIAQFDGIRSVIDLKTSKRNKTEADIESYFMQEAGYAIMFEERTGIPITQLVTIMSVDDMKPKVFIQHRDTWAPKLLETIKEYKRRKLFGHVR